MAFFCKKMLLPLGSFEGLYYICGPKSIYYINIVYDLTKCP